VKDAIYRYVRAGVFDAYSGCCGGVCADEKGSGPGTSGDGEDLEEPGEAD